MTYQDRIAALRSALETVDGECDVCSSVRRLVRDALVADDLAASAPLPDLPLTEGSRMRGGGIVTRGGVDLALNTHEGAPIVSVRLACGERYWIPLLDVLALARRGGHV